MGTTLYPSCTENNPQDRYIFATMVLLVSTCFWHGAQTLISDDELEIKKEADLIALVILAGSYLIYNMQFIMRIIFVVNEPLLVHRVRVSW